MSVSRNITVQTYLINTRKFNMAKLTIDLGTAGNSATGDSIRGAFNKINQNFTEIYNELGADGTFSNIGFSGNSIISDDTNGDIILDPNGSGRIVVDARIINRSTNANIVISPNGTGALDVDTSRIINVTDPTSAQDAATKNYVDTQLSSSSHNITFVGDDSTGTAVTQGETFKFAGTQNVTTAVSGDTLTITGPDLTNYLNSTQISVSGNKISTTESNANIELDPNGTGDVIINSGDILPATDNTQYLGSASKRWHTLYVGPGSININGVSISESSGTIQIPGGLTGTQGLGALLLSDPTQIPYSDVDNQGAAFTFDSNTVFYDTETKEAIATKVSSDLDWAGWTIGDAFPNSLGLTSPTFTHTHSAGALTGLKIATGGSGLSEIATDNILAFRVGDPITTFIVTPYSGLLGTVNEQSSTQSDLTATNSLSVGGLATVYGESIFYDNLDVKGNKITNLGTPTAGGDAATKSYVDTQLSSSSHNITFVGDDSTGTAVTQGETFKFAGTQNVTTAVSGDTLTITGPDLSSYLTSETSHADVLVDGDFASAGFMKTDGAGTYSIDANTYLTSVAFGDLTSTPTTLSGYGITDAASSTATAVTVVGDDSSGTAVTLGETFKIAGTQNITTAVSGDTLTITGPDLSSYLQNTGTQTIDNISFNDNIISTSSNADLNLNPGGTGQVVANSALKINKGYIEAINSLTSSSTITVDFSEASVHTVTLAENTEFVVTNLPTGATGTIIITQDGGGSNTGSFGTDGSTAVKFAGGTPTLSTAGNAIDVVTVFNDGTNYLGNIAKAYAA